MLYQRFFIPEKAGQGIIKCEPISQIPSFSKENPSVLKLAAITTCCFFSSYGQVLLFRKMNLNWHIYLHHKSDISPALLSLILFYVPTLFPEKPYFMLTFYPGHRLSLIHI